MIISKIQKFINKIDAMEMLEAGLREYTGDIRWQGFARSGGYSDFIRSRLFDSIDASGNKFGTYSAVTIAIRSRLGLPTPPNYTFLFTGNLYDKVQITPAVNFVSIKFPNTHPQGREYIDIFNRYGGGVKNVMGAIWSFKDKNIVVKNIIKYLKNG